MSWNKMLLSAFVGFAFSITNVQIQNSKTKVESQFDNEDVIANAHLSDGTTSDLFYELAAKDDVDAYINDTYASYYFKNLRENFGNNVYGSCAYVSIGMLLSFYDAYWDDSFIANSYDLNSTYNSVSQSYADFSLVPSDAESPGIRFEPMSMLPENNVDEYLNVAAQNSNLYFQFKLFDLAKEHFGSFSLDGSQGTMGMNSQEIYDFLDYYIHGYKGYSNTDVVTNLYISSDDSLMKSNVVTNVENGNPVILVVKQPNTVKAHSVVAYDYNSGSGEIYVHTGWRDETNNIALTHVSLSDLGYTEIVSAISLQVNSSKNLGHKYYSESGDSSFASTFIFPREMELVSGNFADMNPMFSWKSLYTEKWEMDKNPYFRLSVLNSNRNPLFTVDNIRSLSYTFTDSQWETILYETSGEKYYVMLTLCSDTYPYWDDYWYRVEFTKPDTYQNKPYIAPAEYGFEDAYPTDDVTKTTFKTHSVRGFNFETRRYRVGYIHEEDIVMSPIRKGINEAFIEYRFETALNRIDVELSHWREQASEWLSSSNGMAAIQQYIGNSWVTVLDLLSSDANLPRDRNNKNTYKIEFMQPAYRIRFYAKYNGNTTNDNNKGRICIGNMAFYESNFNLPLSGSELDYEPELWNNKVRLQFLWIKKYVYDKTNCYSYAVNAQINPTTKKVDMMQPGQANGQTISRIDLLDTNKVLSAIRSDAAILGFEFNEIGADEPCPAGRYKVAFVIDNQYTSGDATDYDYHWYRQNSDGTWSHKPGRTRVRNTDNSKKIIMDPKICNRNAGNGLNYNLFVGFYSVRPLNLMY